jgi:hypothetical protein
MLVMYFDIFFELKIEANIIHKERQKLGVENIALRLYKDVKGYV